MFNVSRLLLIKTSQSNNWIIPRDGHLVSCSFIASRIMRIVGTPLLQMGSQASQVNVYQRVLATFPDGIRMAFAYGSGVFQQVGQETSKNMLDFIFVVDNPEKWHTENVVRNMSHYSFLSKFGPRLITDIQNNYGAGIYFNTLVPFEQRLIKYGVISTDRLVSDLTDWVTLYVSGRMHKPVYYVVGPDASSPIQDALTLNLQSAVHAALLLLPESFTELELFTKLASLSYSGDFRMKFGEDKSKVDNIVRPNIAHFRDLYRDSIEKQDSVVWNTTYDRFEQCISSMSRAGHLTRLPVTVNAGLQRLLCDKHRHTPQSDMQEVIHRVAHDDHCPLLVAQSMANIVNQSSWSQSVKSVLTAGLQKSVRYSWAKVNKMVKGMMRKS